MLTLQKYFINPMMGNYLFTLHRTEKAKCKIKTTQYNTQGIYLPVSQEPELEQNVIVYQFSVHGNPVFKSSMRFCLYSVSHSI